MLIKYFVGNHLIIPIYKLGFFIIYLIATLLFSSNILYLINKNVYNSYIFLFICLSSKAYFSSYSGTTVEIRKKIEMDNMNLNKLSFKDYQFSIHLGIFPP